MTEQLISKEFISVVVTIEGSDLVRIAIKDNATLTVPDIGEIVEWLKQEFGERKFKVLSVPGEHSIISSEVRAFMSSPERSTRVIADAMVVTSLPHRLWANFYIQFNRPSIPAKVFGNENSARTWLENY